MELTDLEIAEYLGSMCSDNQTMVNFLQSRLNIKIDTIPRIIMTGQFETNYYYQREYISTKGDANSSIVIGIWRFLSDEQRQVLEDMLQKQLSKKNNLVEIADKYKKEKAKGGLNSYQAYKPLKKKVEELCLEILSKKPNTPALQLVKQVSKIIETDFKDLLKDFDPYKNYKNDGTDWTCKTFYNWCNDIRKAYKS